MLRAITGLVAGWEVQCEVAGLRAGAVEILSVDNVALRAFRGKALIRQRGGRPAPGSDLQTMLQLVFGLR